MKRLLLVLIIPFLTACPHNAPPVTTCSMTYNCGYNAACQSQYGVYNHSGSFADQDQSTAEAECVAWEYAFINGYGSTYSGIHPVVSQCQCVTQ